MSLQIFKWSSNTEGWPKRCLQCHKDHHRSSVDVGRCTNINKKVNVDKHAHTHDNWIIGSDINSWPTRGENPSHPCKAIEHSKKDPNPHTLFSADTNLPALSVNNYLRHEKIISNQTSLSLQYLISEIYIAFRRFWNLFRISPTVSFEVFLYKHPLNNRWI